MLLYAITGRGLLPGSGRERLESLISLAREWARGGVDFIQVREKDLAPAELLALARQIVSAVREEASAARVLVNGSPEIAVEAAADGVHLPGNAPEGVSDRVLAIYQRAGREAIISRACHSVEEVTVAQHASVIVFAPVFEKMDSPDGLAVPGQGVSALARACRAAAPVPVFALGGVTRENAAECVAAGAVGVAGIRLFLGEEWKSLR
jgi:thiamine-phosphate pyrophosphorylase